MGMSNRKQVLREIGKVLVNFGNLTFASLVWWRSCNAIYHAGDYYADKCRRRTMNLIILLCIPLVPAIIITIYAVVTNKKETKHTEPETA
jgi:hypothetical protein